MHQKTVKYLRTFVDKFRKNSILFKCILFFIIISLCTCSTDKADKEKEIILAQVGDVSITLDEFINRTEMTIRPKYCNQDNNIAKKIMLNSLIAEKMLALEARNNEVLKSNKRFQQYIQGIKEQAMREELLKEDVYSKVKADESKIQNEFDLAGRNYNIQYYNIYVDSVALMLDSEKLNQEGEFERIHGKYWPGKTINERHVTWDSQDNQLIHQALFSRPLKKNSVVGPIRIDEGNYIIIKVLGWTDEIVLTDSGRKERWDAIKQQQILKQAQQDYNKYVAGVMAGKKLEFNPEILTKMVQLVKPFYTLSPDKKNEMFLKVAFNKSSKNPELNHLAEGVSEILNETLFTIDGESWTVSRYMNELQRHPLVFRDNNKKDKNFMTQYKFAIIDMVRDHYLTKKAYDRGLENNEKVRSYTQMWKDALMAQFEVNRYLQENVPGVTDSIKISVMLEEYLNPYIDSLQNKYSDKIRVNVEEFNKYHPTRVDMITLKKNVPYPVMVPAFPQITTDNKLDYGNRME